MARTIEKTLYQFDELSDGAKDSARDWWRSTSESDDLSDSEDWHAIADILGISFGGTKARPAIYWSGFCSQGDGASWEGSYAYAKGAPRKMRAYAPLDKELHRIADELQAVQRRNFYRLSATVDHPRHARYQHSGTMGISVDNSEYGWRAVGEDAGEAIDQLMRDFADWIYSQLEKQWEYVNSDENVDESIRINEYEFDEDGNRA